MKKATKLPLAFKIIYGLLVLFILTGGYIYFLTQSEQLKLDAHKELEAINNLKAGQIISWMEVRQSFARTIQHDPFFSSELANLLKSSSSLPPGNKVELWVQNIQTNYDFDNVHLFKSNSELIYSSDLDLKEVEEHKLEILHHPANNKHITIFDFHRHYSDKIHVGLSIPINFDDNTIAYLIIDIDPEQYLYPIINSWPIESKTAETILARSEKDSVLILSQVRYQPDSKFKLTIPLSEKENTLVRASAGHRGMVEGFDYRGVKVLASVLSIPGSSWLLTSEIDLDEVMEPLISRGIIIASFAFLFLFAAAGVVYAMWRHQNAEYFKKRLELEHSRNALSKHYEFLTKYANDIILLLNEDGTIAEVNQRAVDTYQYSREELIGMDIKILRAEEERELIAQQLKQVEVSQGYVFQTFHQKKDGSVLPVEVSARFIKIENKKFFQAIIRDITDRKEAEARIQRANRIYAVLSQVNQTIVRIKNRDLLFKEICRILIDYGLFRMSWIGLIEFDTHIVKPVAIAGYDDGYLDLVTIKSNEDPEGRGPSGTAIRSGHCVAFNDLETNPDFFPWRDEAIKRNYHSCIAAPFEINGVIAGTLNVYSEEARFFRQEEIDLFDEIARDVSFALEVMGQEEKRKAAENELKDSELRYRTVFDSSNDAIFVLDGKKIIECNVKCMKMFDVTREEFIGKNPFDYSPAMQPDNRNSEESGMEKIQQALMGNSQYFEWKHMTKEGFQFDTEVSLNRFELKGKTYLLAVVHDISARKKAEEALRQHSIRNRIILDTAGDGFHIVNLNGKIVEVNQSFSRMLGYTERELLKMEIKDFDVQWNQDELIKRIKELVNLKNSTFETKHRRKDGSVRDVEIRSNYLNLNGEDLLFCSARDITDKKQTELELKKMFRSVEQSTVSVVITNTEGIIEYVNPRVCETSGYERNELIGQNPRIFKSGSSSIATYHELWETIKSGNDWQGEFHNKRKNGEYYWETATISPIKDENGNISHFIAIKENITERKRLESELIEAKEKAEEMNRLKSIFLANMSHELRTPMIGILGYAEMLESEIEDEVKRDMISIILQSGKRLNETLNSILDLSKIESNNQELKIEKVNINEILIECEKLFKVTANEKNLDVIIKLPKEIIYAHLDEEVTRKILNNLISNAIKYTERGSIVLSAFERGDNIVIHVSDTGIGISNKNLNVIFEPFRQVSEGLNRNFEGTGLGLTITRRFVEMMNGKISVFSELGKGSLFEIIFPKHNTSDNNITPSPETKKNPGDDSTINTQPPRLKVMLVEDDEVSATVIKKYLANSYLIDHFESGEETLKAASSAKYDLFLMDISLKGKLSGVEVVQELRKMNNYKSTPIIAVTAFAMSGDKERFIAHGCTHYISKPFIKAELLQVITEAINYQNTTK